MRITLVNDFQVAIELVDREIAIIKGIFVEVKNILDYEPEFQTRLGVYYADAEKLIVSLRNNYIASLKELVILNNIMNEACNGVNIKDFDVKIGISEAEAESYLHIISKAIKELRKI